MACAPSWCARRPARVLLDRLARWAAPQSTLCGCSGNRALETGADGCCLCRERSCGRWSSSTSHHPASSATGCAQAQPHSETDNHRPRGPSLPQRSQARPAHVCPAALFHQYAQVQAKLDECQERVDTQLEQLRPVWDAMDEQLKSSPGGARGEQADVAARLAYLRQTMSQGPGLLPKLELLKVS